MEYTVIFIHLHLLLICNRQVGPYICIIKNHSVDSDGLRDYIVKHSIFNPLQKQEDYDNYFCLWNDDQSLDEIPRDVKDLVFCQYGCNEAFTTLDFSSLPLSHLESIVISSNSFSHVREFVLDGLDKLESVIVDRHSFIHPMYDQGDEDAVLENSVCRIVNCSSIRQVRFGSNCMLGYEKLELSNLDSLHSIEFGLCSFLFAEKCILKGE